MQVFLGSVELFVTHELSDDFGVLCSFELFGAIVMPKVVESNVVYRWVVEFLSKVVSESSEGFSVSFVSAFKKSVCWFKILFGYVVL